MRYGKGCLESPRDERDYQLADLVASVDNTEYPSERIPPRDIVLFDQGQTSMCCACAVAMSRYIYEIKDSGNNKPMSPTYIYGNRAESVVIDGIYDGEGMYLKDALKQLINSGDCYLETLSVFGTYKDCKSSYDKIKEVADTEARPYRVSSYYSVTTKKQVMKAIIETGSVLASYLVTEGWYDTGSDGVITNSGDTEGGHAVLIVGWKMINNKLHWVILNSWGDSWGDHGYGYYDADKKFREAYCILDSVKEVEMSNNG